MPEKSTGPGSGHGPAAGLPGEYGRYGDLLQPALEALLPSGEGFAGPVVEAMRYSLLAPGKRIRPVLTMVSAELAGGDPASVIEAAAAVEMIHTASLILDDLPCMDNAGLRRGREALHRHTDEATAVLAADALLMQAFALLGAAVAKAGLAPGEAGRLVKAAADCVGVPGMIGGQYKDLHPENTDFDSLEYVHSHKTGALFTLSATLGARLSGAGQRVLECLEAYAKNLGLAFQIVDDILDARASSRELGKDVRTDTNRATFVTMFGERHARTVAAELIETAKVSLEPFGDKARLLLQLADFVYQRKK
ncbi:MAG: polyprenyl synthetase family protein [Candidatus Glassbacteria bacterium]|nr:polyprenyl synthetase family protein [Candidatus Glassbacteria bacterium]